MISHDTCCITRLRADGGRGYGHIFGHDLPPMRERGFSEAGIRAIMVEARGAACGSSELQPGNACAAGLRYR